MALVAVVAVVGGIAALSAYEAHVINVTAHIENALSVPTSHIGFGTVFPQETVNENFTLGFSSSFLAQSRVNVVNYKIVQKPKPIWPKPAGCTQPYSTEEAARAYCIAQTTPDLTCCYRDLCKFLSKTDADPEDSNDTSEPSYFVPGLTGAPATCNMQQPQATGRLDKTLVGATPAPADPTDAWTVDLKVPPIDGTVGQDWPAGCPTVSAEADYGCDLWIEVTGITQAQ